MLPSDVLAASIRPSSHGKSTTPASTGVEDDIDDLNANSILVLSDNLGRMHCFLDGSFPLGDVHIRLNLSTLSISKDPKLPLFFTHPSVGEATALRPLMIDVPLLATRHPRDMAKLSSTARELVWYILRVVKEMRTSWYGTESFTGAREFGPKWLQALKVKQENDFGRMSLMIMIFFMN